MTEEEAIKLCQKWQYILPQSYSCEDPDDFVPHRWVVEAILEAAQGPYEGDALEDWLK